MQKLEEVGSSMKVSSYFFRIVTDLCRFILLIHELFTAEGPDLD